MLYKEMDSTNIYGVQPQKSFTQSTKEYFQTNDMVGNFVFLMVLLVIGVIIFTLVSSFFLQHMTPSNQPHLINGMVNGMKEFKINQGKNLSNDQTVLVSNNKEKGLEFTWSYWIYIEDLDYRKGELKNVFIKGDNNYMNDKDQHEGEETLYQEQVKQLINGPGVYLTPFDNKLLFAFNTFDDVIESFEIDNLPMQKWFNVIIRCENKTIDVFINGTFVKRHKLKSLPRQNYNNVYIGKNGGFSGYVSNLWYYTYAIGTKAIHDIYRRGVNMKLLNDSDHKGKKGTIDVKDYERSFLSFRWLS